jgi:D-alanyl-D-alanine carboxypeptidase
MHAAVVDAEGRLDRRRADEALVPWWSFTKSLIAAAALRLAEAGRLDLDAPVDRHPFTARQFLQHRAGLGDYGGHPAYQAGVAADCEPWSDAQLFATVPLDRLLFVPGTRFAYSNVGYLLLRRLIEERFGAGLDVALADLVLGPLGLTGSRLARTRADMAPTALASSSPYHPGWAFHGVVVGPVAEAALALHRLLTGDLLAPRSLAAMLAAVPVGGALPGRPWQRTGYGLGLMIGAMQAPGGLRPLEVAGHSAGGPGSVGAVYHAVTRVGRRTAAVFAAGDDEAVAEHAVLPLLTATSAGITG